MDRLKQWFSWDQADALVALAASVVVGVLGLLNVVTGDALTAATLLVLAAIAVAILRERSSREAFVTGASNVQNAVTKIEESVTKIEESVARLRSGTPYRILRYEVEWDLRTRDLTCARKVKRLRFLQNNVISLWDYTATDAEIVDVKYSHGKLVDTFTEGNRTFDLISLGRRYHSGEPDIDFKVEREVRGAFPDPQNWVTAVIVDPTDVLVLKVIWPPDAPPEKTLLERIGPMPSTRDIDATELQQVDGRTCFSHTIEHPAQGETVRLVWDW